MGLSKTTMPLEDLREDALNRIEKGQMITDEQWGRLSMSNLVFECVFRINQRLKKIEEMLEKK